ncbi:MAG TPA: sugar ABC transporter permease [Firmicutes bacterium]|jgi:ABC-type sugar transport system permease subunit|nr:sugar ABC transporter permease [Bacillota bacterium]
MYSSVSQWMRRYGVGLLFILPALVAIGAVFVYPMVSSFYLSLHDIDLTKPWRGEIFVGLKNYRSILANSAFWDSVWRTAYFSVVSVGLELLIGFISALLLNEVFAGRSTVRSFLLIPWALLTMTNGLMWMWIFNPHYGMFNAILTKLGLIDSYRVWLADPFWAMHAVILADVWKMAPFMTLLILAGLQPISEDVYDAAEVDGASTWTKIRYIVGPLLRPALLVAVVLRTMGAFKVFDIIYIMTSGGPADSTKVLTFYTYEQAFRYYRIGMGSAVSWLITLVLLILIVVYIKLLGAEVE